MKARALLAGVLVLVWARAAIAADPPPNVLVVNESQDAWLHDHCSYRGTRIVTKNDKIVAGEITTLVYLKGDTATAKAFVCAEAPPFVKDFTPATPEALACVPGASAVCVAPLAKPKAPPVVVAAAPAPTPPKPIAAMPEPPLPKWPRKAAREAASKAKKSSGIRVVDKMDAGY